MYIGSFWSSSRDLSDSEQSENALDPSIASLPGPLPQTPIAGRMTPVSLAPDSSWDANQFVATPRPTGNQSLTWPREADLPRSLRIYKFVISGSYSELLLIMQNLEPLSANVAFIGAALDWGSPIVLGQRLGWTLTLRFRLPSFGTVTVATNMLSSMNLEVVFPLSTSYDGLTGTLFLWKSRVPQSH